MGRPRKLDMDSMAIGADNFTGNLPQEIVEKTQPTQTADVAELRSLVSDLSSQVQRMSTPRSSATIRKRVKEHVAGMREFEIDQKVVGLVTKVWAVKEIKDKTENKRFYGVCKVEVFNPKTNETKVFEDVDYLEFLNNAHTVPCQITKWDKSRRSEVEKKKGGGGIGKLYKQTATGEYVASEEFEFEVEYEDHAFTVEVKEGEFEGETFETSGTGFNL